MDRILIEHRKEALHAVEVFEIDEIAELVRSRIRELGLTYAELAAQLMGHTDELDKNQIARAMSTPAKVPGYVKTLAGLLLDKRYQEVSRLYTEASTPE